MVELKVTCIYVEVHREHCHEPQVRQTIEQKYPKFGPLPHCVDDGVRLESLRQDIFVGNRVRGSIDGEAVLNARPVAELEGGAPVVVEDGHAAALCGHDLRYGCRMRSGQ